MCRWSIEDEQPLKLDCYSCGCSESVNYGKHVPGKDGTCQRCG